jgi:hypothetical protein
MTAIARIVIVSALVTFGCGNKKEDPPKPPVAGSASGVEPSGSGSGSGSAGSGSAVAEPTDVEVPTEVDFEADANAKITDKNLEAEVKALEGQLAQ